MYKISGDVLLLRW
jgi:hypothetical protein